MFFTMNTILQLKKFYYSLIIRELAFGSIRLISSRCLPGTLLDNCPNYSFKIKQKERNIIIIMEQANGILF